MKYQLKSFRIALCSMGTLVVFTALHCINIGIWWPGHRHTINVNGMETLPVPIYPQENYTRDPGEITKRPTFRDPDKPASKLCFSYNGRLGNRLFQYAAVLGIAREKRMTPTMPGGVLSSESFRLGVDTIDGRVCGTYHVQHNKRYAAFDQESVDFDNRYNTMLSGSFQSWRYFRHAEQELRQHFQFKDVILQEANSVIFSALSAKGHEKREGQTLVGVHVRRGDMMNEDLARLGYNVAPRDYYLRAMDFFLGKFSSVIFVVCSENKQWPLTFLPNDKRTIFIEPRSAELDLAVLSLCDHVIMSVGSYGWWAGWLAGGITVYYKHQVKPGSLVDVGFLLEDYMPPEWIGLE